MKPALKGFFRFSVKHVRHSTYKMCLEYVKSGYSWGYDVDFEFDVYFSEERAIRKAKYKAIQLYRAQQRDRRTVKRGIERMNALACAKRAGIWVD
jgi:hypothetical protein